MAEIRDISKVRFRLEGTVDCVLFTKAIAVLADEVLPLNTRRNARIVWNFASSPRDRFALCGFNSLL